jgi:hypothetical protein
MKRLVLAAGLALAATAIHAQETPVPADPPASAQDAPATSLPPTSEQEAQAQAASTGHTTQAYHGPHRYPAKTRGRAGDPPIVDHSMDKALVEPTHSTITISSTTP